MYSAESAALPASRRNNPDSPDSPEYLRCETDLSIRRFTSRFSLVGSRSKWSASMTE